MSELKEHQFCESDEFFREYNGPLSNEMRPYYLKSEADKVIAELKKACNAKDDWCLHTLKENRHQKYKRCMAMARWCESENYTACWYHENSERCKWTEKWHNRWLKIAERFKETR